MFKLELKIVENEFLALAGLVGYSFSNLPQGNSTVVFLTVKLLKKAIPELLDLGCSLPEVSKIITDVYERKDIAANNMDLSAKLLWVNLPKEPATKLPVVVCQGQRCGDSPFPHVVLTGNVIGSAIQGIEFCMNGVQRGRFTPEQALIFFRELTELSIPLDKDDYAERFRAMSAKDKMAFRQVRTEGKINEILNEEGYGPISLKFEE